MIKANNIKIIGFDADDTLWVNEPYYRESEDELCELLKKYVSKSETAERLFEIEIKNLPLYGYGTKAFTLSLLETALVVTNNKVTASEIKSIIDIGKSQIQRLNELISGVEEVLKELHSKYRLIVATKGDLLDQERKLIRSGLMQYFHHIEVMSDKQEANYQRLLNHLDILPHEFLMIGNSLKSDVLPVVKLGGHAIHVPYKITWEHEKISEEEFKSLSYTKVRKISEVIDFLGSKNII